MADIGFLGGHKKIVLLGEAGSGKTELALNIAMRIRDHLQDSGEGGDIRFLDMDQTKPMFRSRDVGDSLRAAGITFSVEAQFMDAPVVPYGVIESLGAPDLWTILDVGGSHAGALCLGQFADAIAAADARVFYTINPYRSFSDTTERIADTMRRILAYSRIDDIAIIGNPYVGAKTTLDELLEGDCRLRELIAPLGYTVALTAVPEHLWAAARGKIEGETLCIKPYLRAVLGLSEAQLP